MTEIQLEHLGLLQFAFSHLKNAFLFKKVITSFKALVQEFSHSYQDTSS